MAFGRPYITNPDLADRLLRGLPLAPEVPMTAWYGPGREGYTDFPPHAA